MVEFFNMLIGIAIIIGLIALCVATFPVSAVILLLILISKR